MSFASNDSTAAAATRASRAAARSARDVFSPFSPSRFASASAAATADSAAAILRSREAAKEAGGRGERALLVRCGQNRVQAKTQILRGDVRRGEHERLDVLQAVRL